MTQANFTGVCQWCRGTGTETEVKDQDGNPITRPCTYCAATGIVKSNAGVDITNIYSISRCPTSLILENTNDTEYAALSDNKKAYYNQYISAGTLDMSDGSKARDLFLAWIFPPGKLSYTAILNALNTL